MPMTSAKNFIYLVALNVKMIFSGPPDSLKCKRRRTRKGKNKIDICVGFQLFNIFVSFFKCP